MRMAKLKFGGASRRAIAVAATIGGSVLALVGWYAKPAPPADESKLIDRFLPGAEFSGAVSVRIHATPEAIFRSLREVTLADMPLATLIGEIRYLPSRLLGKPMPTAPAHEPFMELVMSGSGNIVLAESPDRELVLGSIGKFHDPADQHFVALHSPQEFLEFNDPAYQKLVMSFRIVGESADKGYRFVLEHRTHALSPAARVRFALYWLGIKPGGNLVSWLMLRAIKRRAETLETPAEVDTYGG